jgi:hypothetical protein
LGHSSWLRDHQDNLIGVIFIVRDLTEGKRTEEMIRRMDRLTSIGQLSAGIAHEIRNPLASISLNVQMLSKKLALDNAAKNLVSDTLEGIDRIKSLVKGMLDFAKPSTPALQRGSMSRVLRNSIALLHSQLRKKSIEVKLDLAEDLEIVLTSIRFSRSLSICCSMGWRPCPTGAASGSKHHRQRSEKRRRHLALHIMDWRRHRSTNLSRSSILFHHQAGRNRAGPSIVTEILISTTPPLTWSAGRPGTHLYLSFRSISRKYMYRYKIMMSTTTSCSRILSQECPGRKVRHPRGGEGEDAIDLLRKNSVTWCSWMSGFPARTA